MKKFSYLLLAMVILFSATFFAKSIVSQANEVIDSERIERVRGETFYNGTVINTSWKTVATSTSGFNCNVYIKCMNTAFLPNSWTVSPTDIRMLNKSGNVIWQESGAVAGLGERVFWCGSNVYTIQARCQVGSGSSYIRRAN